MACGYISSNDNRFYVVPELNYGQVPAAANTNRIPAVQFSVQQQLDRPNRNDKTGTRTYPGTPVGLRKQTTFDLTTYMTAWTDQSREPAYGPLFEAGMGGAGIAFAGGTAAANTNTKLLTFAAAHHLSPGQAVTSGGEIRFVNSTVDSLTVELNAPFTVTPTAGSPIGASMTYQPATSLPTVSIFDCWSPAEAVQRIVNGAAVDQLKITVNGDYHEFEFSGSAKDVLDSASFNSGDGGLSTFPVEPTLGDFEYTIIPGHMGQAWMGNAPDQFYTVTAATVTIQNAIQTRSREFGTDGPRCVSPGMRTVTVDVALFEMNDAATRGLYQAARQNSPVAIMLQLGQQAGQLVGIHLQSVVPSVPEFDDSETRLQWKFSGCRAQGTGNDEIYIAFG